MFNAIADPLVETPVSADLEGLVAIDSAADGMVVITLNRPELGNAMNSELAQALAEAFETLHGAEHVRIVFLRGAGGCFSRGADLEWLAAGATEWDEGDRKDDALIVAHMFAALTRIPGLTVALVEGDCLGEGAGLVAACDMAVAAADARFAFPEVKSGAVPAVAAPYVVNAIGPRQAKGLFMTGRPFDAAFALRIGLVQQVVEPGTMPEVVGQLTEAAMGNAPGAMHEAKRLVWDVWDKPLDHHLIEETARRFAKARFGEEGLEGIAALTAGRAPGWSNP
jgi:methylglutaconyl-CoA hydratase